MAFELSKEADEVCYFCGQVFNDAAEKNEHILLSHFEHKYCIGCNNNLISIGDNWYQLHIDINCNAVIKLDPNYEEQCTEIDDALDPLTINERRVKDEPIEINESTENVADVLCIENDPLLNGNDCTSKEVLPDPVKRESSARPYSCTLCSKLFKYRHGRSVHMRLHHPSNLWRGSRSTGLRTRSIIARSTVRRYPCAVCSVIFVYRQNRNKHMEIAHGRHAEDDDGEVVEQKRRQYDIKMWACGLCQKKSAFKQSMYRHLRCRHRVEDKSMAIPILDSLGSDERSHSEPPSHENEVPVSVDQTKNDVEISPPDSPEPTNATSSKLKSKSLARPIFSSHSVDSQPAKLPKNSVKLWACGLCPKNSAFKSNIYAHLRTWHGVEDKSLIKSLKQPEKNSNEHANAGAQKQNPKKVSRAKDDDPNVLEASDNLEETSLGDSRHSAQTLRPSKIRDDSVKMWACGLCSSKSAFKPNMYRHIRLSHGLEDKTIAKPILDWPEDDSNGQEQPNKPGQSGMTSKTRTTEPVDMWACGLCSSKSAFKHNMYRHIRSAHGIEDKTMAKPIFDRPEDDDNGQEQPESPVQSVMASETKSQAINDDISYVDEDSNEFRGEESSSAQSECSEQSTSTRNRPPNDRLNDVKMWACGLCSSKSTLKHNMYRHIRSAHGLEDKTMVKPMLDWPEDDGNGQEQPKSPGQSGMTSETKRRAINDDISYVDEDSNEFRGEESSFAQSECSEQSTSTRKRPPNVRTKDVKMWACGLCSSKSAFKANMYRHIRGAHGLEDKTMAKPILDWPEDDDKSSLECSKQSTEPSKRSTRIPRKGVKMWECGVCSKKSAFSTNMYRHLRDWHGVEDKSLAMPILDWIGSTQTRHRIHKNSWSCGLCPKKSAFKHNIYRHLRMAHGTEKYKSMAKQLFNCSGSDD